jgi:hypothetical protein
MQRSWSRLSCISKAEAHVVQSGIANMKTKPLILLACLLFFTLANIASGMTNANSGKQSTPGVEAAKTISTVTGVAISPLLGVGAVGAYEYWKAPAASRPRLAWFAQPWFWVPALILVALVGLKDVAGAGLPPGLKKPLDIAEAIENKISGLVAAGAFVPLIVSVFPQAQINGTQAHLAAFGVATIDLSATVNWLLVPVAVVAFLVVWLAFHSVHMLILVSPFGLIDMALKAARFALLCFIALATLLSPYFSALICIGIIILSYFIAGWSSRLTAFGTVFIWDWITLRERRFRPQAGANCMFTARKIQGVPVRTSGKLSPLPNGGLCFDYRPWLFLKRRQILLPPGSYFIGRGLFYPELAEKQEAKNTTLFALPPRYRTHEQALAAVYGFDAVRDVGWRKGLAGITTWLGQLFANRVPEPLPE